MTEEETAAKRLYDQCPTVKPNWEDLGAATRSVWLERVPRAPTATMSMNEMLGLDEPPAMSMNEMLGID